MPNMNENEARKSALPYAAPELVDGGSVAELTQTSTGGSGSDNTYS